MPTIVGAEFDSESVCYLPWRSTFYFSFNVEINILKLDFSNIFELEVSRPIYIKFTTHTTRFTK